MKIIAIGDTHGRDHWKAIVAKEADADKVVFIGDYFDTFNDSLRGLVELENFKGIIKYKTENDDKVVLLIGNHDFHYLDETQRYSGFNNRYQYIFGDLLADAREQMQMAYIHDVFVFTHAGVTERWLLDNQITIGGINAIYKSKPSAFRFYEGDRSGYGDNWHQSPIWVRPEALLSSMPDGRIQIVGHTRQDGIQHDAFPNAVFIDCLDYTREYLIIDEGKLSVGTF